MRLCVFTWRTILPNFIGTWFVLGVLGFFEECCPNNNNNNKKKNNNNKMTGDKESVSSPKILQVTVISAVSVISSIARHNFGRF